MSTIPNQEDIDWSGPAPVDHIAWAMRNMPTYAGIGAVTHEGFFKEWSEHLVKAGFCHRDYLETLADENGMIHVSRLPEQQIKWQPAMRGPRHGFNNAARWVPVGTPEPEPYRIQDVTKMTIQEQHAVKDMLIRTGVVDTEKPPQHIAEELN